MRSNFGANTNPGIFNTTSVVKRITRVLLREIRMNTRPYGQALRLRERSRGPFFKEGMMSGEEKILKNKPQKHQNRQKRQNRQSTFFVSVGSPCSDRGLS